MKHLIVLYFFLGACASTDDKSSLDIPMPGSAELPESSAIQLVERDRQNIKPTKIVSWQSFFKSNPTPSETKSLRKVIEKSEMNKSHSIEDLLKLARNLRTIGEVKRAEVRYREILNRNSENFDATIEIAEIYLYQRKIERSFDYISKAKKIIASRENPAKLDVFRYKYVLALSLISSQRRDEGHRILTELINEDRKFVNGYLALSESYLAQKKIELTKFIAKRGLDETPNHPSLLNVLGVTFQLDGRHEKAKSYYNRALEQNPNLVAALVNRATLSIHKAAFKSAEIDLNRAIKIAPYYNNALVSQGVLYKKTGRFTSAKIAFQAALDQNPENAFARYNLASLLANRFNDKNQALRLFYEVLQSNELTQEISDLARVQIQGLRDSRISLDDK